MAILVPLGNPGDAYADTRHNLGRLLLLRWIEAQGGAPRLEKAFRTGTLYRLPNGFQALVPATYMNLSGQVCAEAAQAGLTDLLLLHDDKDLPLGTGRFRLDGGDGGHNGLRSVFEHLGSQAVPRLRLGIGPFQRPLADFVLGAWTEAEWAVIEALDAPFARFMTCLGAARSLADLPGQVNAGTFWLPVLP